MSAAMNSHSSGAGPLSLMSCVRESSPPQDVGSEYEPEKNVSTKRKFWNPRKWFKRKSSSHKVVEEVPESNQTLRSRSTSELSVAEEQTRRRSGSPMHPTTLSVSHDSVFHSPHSGSDLDLDAAQSSSSLSISHQPTQPDIKLQTELIERLRQRRGDTSEDDEGLPHSPCNSPSATEGHLEKTHNKELPTKSHSTCSDGSLLSMGSSEMDEDSFDPHVHSRQERSKDVPDADITEWGPIHSSFPLNHSAAHHKVSIRPKRTHGAPRHKRTAAVVLPTTPEVNEDAPGRSLTPEVTSKGPGGADNSKLTRSRSNAGSNGQETFAEEEEEYVEGKNKETSFFGRIFPRRSGKKKRLAEKKEEIRETTKETLSAAGSTTTSTFMYNAKVIETNVRYDPFDRNMIAIDSNLAIRPNALRTGPACRQRVQPIDIPETPEFAKRSAKLSTSSDDIDEWFQKHPSIAPMSNSSLRNSPPHSPLMFSMSPPKSPWSDKRPLMNIKTSKFVDHTASSSTTESKSIVRIAGLSPLQQRVISLNDDDTDTGFKSLTNFPCVEKLSKPVGKSHSFKSTKTNVDDLKVATAYKSMEEKNFIKSLSLDSVKNVNDIEQNVTKPNSLEQFHVIDVTITSRAATNHKAIVNITSNKAHEDDKQPSGKEISVTKVQLNSDDRVSKQIEFSKTKSRFASADGVSIKLRDFEHNGMSVRKFSNDSIELVKRDEIEEKEVNKSDAVSGNTNTSIVTVTTMTNASHYKKMNDPKKSRPVIRKKSNSLDSAESKDSTPRSSQSSIDKLETKSQENIKTSTDCVVRRRSLVKQKDEEPELMKVFARRSLKLKDSEIEALQQQVAKMSEQEERESKTAAVIAAFEVNKSRDSDKENLSDSSPVEERRKPVIAPKASLLETKVKIDGLDVTLRKPISNMLAAFQNRPATIMPCLKNENKILKSNVAATPRPITEMKYVSITADEMKRKDDLTNSIIHAAEIISTISEKSELIDDANVEIHNFRLRKAEWEKRAQESIKKTGL